MGFWSRALVTGASSGIGRAIARQLADEDTDLVLVARSEEELRRLSDELEEAHGVTVEVLVADLVEEADLARVEQRLGRDEDPVDLLVNNAGFGTVGPFVDLDPDVEEDEVRLNALAVLRLAHAAAERMRRDGRGGILNVSSVGGFQPVPYNATYSATKTFVTSLSQALHEELRKDGIHVSVVAPGFTRTEFQDRAEVDVSLLPDVLWSSAEAVAQAAIEGVGRNRALVVPGIHNRVTGMVSQALPHAITRRIAGLAARLGVS